MIRGGQQLIFSLRAVVGPRRGFISEVYYRCWMQKFEMKNDTELEKNVVQWTRDSDKPLLTVCLHTVDREFRSNYAPCLLFRLTLFND